MPAALATAVVGVPEKPRSAKTLPAASRTASRRSSAVERVRGTGVSIYSLTLVVKGHEIPRPVVEDPLAVRQRGNALCRVARVEDVVLGHFGGRGGDDTD